MIIANLALARSVNYDPKVCCKLKHTFMIVNYDPKPFIVQARGLGAAQIAATFSGHTFLLYLGPSL